MGFGYPYHSAFAMKIPGRTSYVCETPMPQQRPFFFLKTGTLIFDLDLD